MAVVRMQVTNVGYWRGQVKRWNNTFHYTTSAMTPDYDAIISAANVIVRGLGATSDPGGNASIAIYPESGGVPLARTVFFDYETVGSWETWNGTIWPTAGLAPPQTGEASVLFEIAAGLSSSGKPVSLKTYWHSFTSVPETNSSSQFSPTVIADATAQYDKLQVLSDGSGGALVISKPNGDAVASSSTMRSYVNNHQRVRGRRRRSVTIDGKRYYPAASSANVVPVEAD